MRTVAPPARAISPAIAWALAITAVTVLLLTALGVLSGVVDGIEGVEALWMLSWPGLPIVGATIVSRRPGNRVGWLLLGIGGGIAVGLAAETYATVGITPADPAAEVAVWWLIDTAGFVLAFGLVPLLVLHFPEPRHDDAVWTWLTRVTAALLVACFIVWLTRDGATLADGTPLSNPWAPPVLGGVAEAAVLPVTNALGVCGVAAVVHAIVAYRRSHGVERLQRRWFAFAAVALPVLLFVGTSVHDATGTTAGKLVQYAAWVIGLNGLAAALATVWVVAVVALVSARWISEPAVFQHAAATQRTRLRALPLTLIGPLGAVAAAGGLITGPLNGLLFVVGEQDLGLRPATVSLLFVLGGPMGLVGLVAGRWMADHWGRIRTAQLGVLVVATAGAIAYAGSFQALAIGYPLGVFSVSLPAPAIGALAIELIPTTVRGAASGILAAAGTAAGVVGLVAAGALADAMGGYRGPMTLLALMAIPAAWVIGRIEEPQAAAGPSPAAQTGSMP